ETMPAPRGMAGAFAISARPRHGGRDSNSQPLVLETRALPIELPPYDGAATWLTSLPMLRVLAAPRAEFRHLEAVRIVLPVLRRRVRARPAGLARERDDRAVVLWHIRLLQDLRHRVLRSNFLLRHRRVSLPVSPPRGS